MGPCPGRNGRSFRPLTPGLHRSCPMDAEDGKGLTFPRGTAFLALPAGRLALRVQR